MRHKLRYYLEYALLRGMAALAGRLPHRIGLLVGWGAAALGYLLLRNKMRRIEARVRQVFGDKRSPREVREIVWRAWRNLAFNAIESMRTPRMTLEWIKRVTNHEEIHKLFDLLKGERGVVLAVPHMGNWELAGVAAQLLGAQLMIIVRRQKNPLATAWLNRVRGQAGIEAFEREAHSMAGIVKGLQHGKVLAILPDLRAKGDFVRVPFLGHEAQIPSGMAVFARNANVPIIPAYVIREGWTRHRWFGFEPIFPDPAADRDADVRRMTTRVIEVFDQAIREHPDQFFWFNSRWILGEEPSAQPRP